MLNIGIDLGTTNSLIAVWKDGQSTLIQNAHGNFLTPSVVSIDDDGTVLIGDTAKERLISHPDLTAANFKRFMGSDKKFQLGKKFYRPEELSSLILRQLKEDAEAVLGEPVTEVIISVPAYFNNIQRNATKLAGTMAGLNVTRIINEPSAAGLAYGLHEKNNKNVASKFLVFDLGGGTFDVSVIELFDGIMEIKASTGNNHLGGEDFTNVIIADFISQHPKIRDTFKGATEHRQAKAVLYKRAEQVKRNLSKSDSVALKIIFQGEEYHSNFTNEQFEKKSEDLLQKIREPIIRALHDASLSVKELDRIVLVGGATRMPIIKRLVAKLFGQLPLAHINPDEVVAYGAAIQAGLKMRDTHLSDIVVTDVCPYTMGTAVVDYFTNHQSSKKLVYFPIIERNTTIPVSRVETVHSIVDNQKKMRVEIFQGESYDLNENIRLGELEFSIPQKPAGEVKVDIRYTYDINGLLEAEATVLNTNEKHQLIIQGCNAEMTEQEIKECLKRLAKLKIHTRENAANKLLLSRAARIYSETTERLRSFVGNLISQFQNALDSQDPILISKAQKIMGDELARMEDELRVF